MRRKYRQWPTAIVDRTRELWNVDPGLPEAHGRAIAATLSAEFERKVSLRDVYQLAGRFRGFQVRKCGGSGANRYGSGNDYTPVFLAEALEAWFTTSTTKVIAADLSRRYGIKLTGDALIGLAHRNHFPPKPRAPRTPRSAKVFTRDVLRRARELAASGMSAPEAAAELGVKWRSLKMACRTDGGPPIRWQGKAHQAVKAARRLAAAQTPKWMPVTSTGGAKDAALARAKAALQQEVELARAEASTAPLYRGGPI